MAQELDLENGPTIDWVFAQGVSHLLAAKYFMLASFVMLVYDHALTFSDEVDRIWQREWTGATWLFALNRYLTELQFIVNLVSFHDPSWSAKVCDRFIPFPGVSTLVSVGIAEIVLILRTYALYQRSNYILALLTALWCGQMIVMAATMLDPVRVPLPEGLVGCIMGAHSEFAAAFWLAPLAMDTFITGLTVLKTLQYLRRDRNHARLIHIILRDGLLYFAVIVAANLFNCLAYYLAPEDLKVVGASFSQIITIMMISRLQLNLRSGSITSPKSPSTGHPSLPPLPISSNREKRLDSKGTSGTISTLSHFFDSTVTELGKDIASLIPEVGEGQAETIVETQVVDEEMEIEMGPIRPVSGGVQDDNVFSEEEREWLETMIQVSPAIVEERRDDG